MRFAIDEFRTKIEDNIAVQQMLHFYEYASLNSNLVYLTKKENENFANSVKLPDLVQTSSQLPHRDRLLFAQVYSLRRKFITSSIKKKLK